MDICFKKVVAALRFHVPKLLEACGDKQKPLSQAATMLYLPFFQWVTA